MKSQEERTGPAGQLDPQELAQKILEETQSHMQAVESLQKATARGTRGGTSLSTPSTPTLSPTGGARGFQPSETSAFSRPPSRSSLRACASPLSLSSHLSPLSASISTPPPTRPKPPSRSSSLQKISSGDCSAARSSAVKKQPPSPRASHVSPPRSPACSAPSPALSYSSTGSVSASSTPELSRSKQESRVQTIHSLKSFWANAGQKHEPPCAATLLRSGNKKMSTVQKDVLGLLNLSPRHEPVRKDAQGPNGHQNLEVKPPPPPSSSLPTNSKGGVRLPSGNGYKFHTAGHFYPSSKC